MSIISIVFCRFFKLISIARRSEKYPNSALLVSELSTAPSFSRVALVLLLFTLFSPWSLWAADPICTNGAGKFAVSYSYKVVPDGVGISYQAWFEFDPITDVSVYNMEVTEYSLNTIPVTLGRQFSYDTKNPPTSIDEYTLHRTNSGSFGVILHTGSAHNTNADALSQLEGYYGAITGTAVVSYECPSSVEVSVLAQSVLEESRDKLTATYTATLTNNGTKDAEGIELSIVLPAELHFQSVSDTRCSPPLPFVGGTITCHDLSILGKDDPLGRNYESIEVITRVINASDLKDEVTMLAKVPEDIDISNNEDSTRVRPNLIGTVEGTIQAMEVLAPYFDYQAPSSLLDQQCNIYMEDIFSRLEAIRDANPSVFENLSYAKITSGDYYWAPIENAVTRAGHVGVVVYLKGSDYHNTGIIIHGTPTWSPVDSDPDSRQGTQEAGEHLSLFGGSSFSSILGFGTQGHGMYYRTPINNFPGSPAPEANNGCGLEGVYINNHDEFTERATLPACTNSTTNAKSCPIASKSVIVRTESPVDILISNSQSQHVETREGKIFRQELDSGIYSWPTQHQDGTFGWLMVLPEDDYDVQLLGTSQGSYKLTVITFDENGKVEESVYEDTTVIDQVSKYQIDTAPIIAATGSSSSGGGGSTDAGLLFLLTLLLLAKRQWQIQAGNKRAVSCN